MGKILIIVGPSGSGKTAVAETLIRTNRCIKITTCTTRSPRPGEIDGIHYNFMDEEEFEGYEACGEFVETFEYAGNKYGTRKKDVEELIQRPDTDIVIVMEFNGAKAIKSHFPASTTIVYLKRDYKDLIMAILEREIPNEDKANRIVQLQEDFKVENAPEVDYVVENETGKILETVKKVEEILKG